MTQATTTISVTRALTLLKTLAAKIQDAQNARFVGFASGARDRSPDAVEKLSKNIQSAHDTLTGLVNRRTKIKAAIIKSNANTVIDFRGEKISVAEAIERRTNTVNQLRSTMSIMLRQHEEVQTQQKRADQQVAEATAKLEANLFGREATSGDRTSEMELIRKTQEQNLGGQIVDPCNILSKNEQIRSELADFDGELDSLLSEVNARTNIEIPA